MSNQIVISSGAKVRNLSGVLTGTAGVVNALGINVPSGIPQLDGSGKILVSQLPNSVMEYKGTWNAATNTPTLANGTGNQGDVYLVSVAGTVNFGAGAITFAVGDQVIYSGTIWQKAGGSTGTVTSVSVTESGDALTITGSPITTSGTINIGFAGTSGQYVNGAGGLTTFPSLTGFVPYTGATANVNLGEFGLSGGYIGLDTTPTSTPTTLGTMSWDSFYLTPKVITGVGDTTLQIGQEEVLLVHNNTGSTLSDGQVVYVTGSTGELPSVSLADASSETTSAATLGVVTESIANGTNGFITVSGIVHGLNTLAFNEGDLLWLSETAGQFTNVKPISPAHLVLIGYVIKKAGGNGSILVKIQNTQELKECSDVLFTSLANNDILAYESSTQLWKNKTIPAVLGYTPQAQLNGTGFVKATGTTISYDNSTYLTTSAAASTYVPYTGATTNVNIGSNLFSAATIRIDGDNTSNFGYLGFKQFSGGNSGLNGYTSIYAQGAGSINIAFSQSGGNKTIAFLSNLISNSTTRSYSFPDADGTIALTSNLSAYLPLTGGTLSGALNINLGSGTGLNVASDLVVFRASTGFATPRQITLAAGNGATTYLEAKGYGGNYITDFGIRTYNSSGTAFEVFFATSAGNVGIGTTSPNSYSGFTNLQVNGSTYGLVQVSGSSSTLASFYAGAGGGNIGTTSNHPFLIFTNDTERLRITSGGNVGIGTTSPSGILELKSSAATNSVVFGVVGSIYNVISLNGTNVEGQYLGIAGGGGTDTNLYYSSGNAGAHIFRTGDGSAYTERMRITSGGQLLVGTSTSLSPAGVASSHSFLALGGSQWVTAFQSNAASAPYGLVVNYTSASPNSTSSQFLYLNDNAAVRAQFYSNGGLGNYQANNVNLSDERTKKDIIPLESYWDKFKAIEIVKFKYKDQTHDDFNIGVIAQQVEAVAPEFIDIDGWGETPEDGIPLKSVYTADLHHATIKVLQECMTKIEELKSEIDELKNK